MLTIINYIYEKLKFKDLTLKQAIEVVKTLNKTLSFNIQPFISFESAFKVAKTTSNDTNFFHFANDGKKPVPLF